MSSQDQVIRANIFRISGFMFFFSRIGPFIIVRRKKILVEKCLVENFLNVEPGSGHILEWKRFSFVHQVSLKEQPGGIPTASFDPVPLPCNNTYARRTPEVTIKKI